MTDQSVERPGGVTFVVVLAWLVAMADVAAGILLLLHSFGTDVIASIDIKDDTLRYYAFALLVLGALTALIAYSLGKGSQGARVFTIIVMALRLANALWAILVFQNFTLWVAIIDAALAIAILVLLTNKSASNFFRNRVGA